MKVKLDGSVASNASLALDPLAARLFNNPGMRIVGVVELAHVERTEPAPDEDKESVVKLGIKHLEIGRDEQEDHLRRAMRALYLHRTAQGKLDEDGEVELSQRTLELTAGLLNSVETARLRVALAHWREYARQATVGQLTMTQLREELSTIADGLGAVLNGVDDGD
jgi:adhesin HecA-like repeat protein